MTHKHDLDLAESRARQMMIADPTLSIRAAARQVGMPESTLRGRLKQSAPTLVDSAPEGVFADGSATLSGEGESPEAVLRAHDVDPEQYEIVSVRASHWDGKQAIRVSAVRKDSLLQLPDPSAWTPPPPPKPPTYGDRSVVIAGDHHAPYHDRGLHSAFLDFLADEQPDELILLGDTGDFDSISRHRSRPGFTASLNKINDAVVGILLDYRDASPNTHITLLRGNHDDRLEYAVIDNNPEFYGVRPGIMQGGDEVPALSLRRLWHLDDLGIDLIDEDWKLGKHPVTDSLTARHGYIVSNVGDKMLKKHSNSQIQGHTHRMSFLYRTKHDPIDVRVAIEAGTMADLNKLSYYETEPNWQQGFIHGFLWEDGDFALSPAIYIRGRLLIADGRRYTANS